MRPLNKRPIINKQSIINNRISILYYNIYNMKKCPPGVICIENYSIFFIFICFVIVVYITYTIFYRQNIIVNNSPSEKIVIKDTTRENNNQGWGGWFGGWIPSWPYNNLPSDPLLNPYAPPLRDERYFIPGFPMGGIPPGAVPINVSTNIGAVDTQYRQLGIMTATNSNGKIIPLMGRPLFTNRDKWQYYTSSNEGNGIGIKLPVSKAGRSCTNEYGCDKLYNGDTVYIEGINEPYRVTVYDNDTIKYLPFI